MKAEKSRPEILREGKTWRERDREREREINRQRDRVRAQEMQ